MFLPIIEKESNELIQIPPGIIPFEIIVTYESAPVEEVTIVETEAIGETVSIEPAPTEEVISVEPQPTDEVISVEPEPIQEVAVEPTKESSISGDIESTDTNTKENIDVDEVLNEETAPHIPEGAIPIVVKISHYDPNLGGTNCAAWYDGGCQSHLANGERWQDYYDEGKTIACPMEIPFGSKIYLDYVEYTCRDRGGAIVITYEGYYWIDILAKKTPYYYGELKDAWLYIP